MTSDQRAHLPRWPALGVMPPGKPELAINVDPDVHAQVLLAPARRGQRLGLG